MTKTTIAIFTVALLFGCDDGAEESLTTAASTAEQTPPTEAETPPVPEIPEVPLDEAQQAKATEIAGQVRPNRTFPTEATNDKQNAQVFLHLAASSDDENVVAAALSALRGTWTNDESQVERGSSMVDETYEQVVIARMSDSRPTVQVAAFSAAVPAIRGDAPREAVLNALVSIASSHPQPAGRYAALDELWNADLSGNAERLAPYVQALDASEPWLVSLSLFRLQRMLHRYPDVAALKTKLIALVGHADPGVRGRAAIVLGELTGWNQDMKPEAVAAITPLFSDAHPFVKSAACKAMTAARHVPAIHAMMGLLDDATSNTYDIDGWQTLTGTPGRVHHDGSAWSRVNDAALYAIKSLSSRAGGERFDYNVGHQDVEGDLGRAADQARAWYRGARSSIPEE